MIHSLSIHRPYQCRHSGACCTAGWTIPIEASAFDALGQAADGVLLFPAPSGSYVGLLDCDDHGRCWYFTDTPAASRGRCSIHAGVGVHAMPRACRQFPRVAVLRPGSTAVSLSAFCPTAASLILESCAPVRIESEVPEFTARAPYEGLDVRTALPPLLRTDALFSWEGFHRWEQFVLTSLAGGHANVDAALAHIAMIAERLRTWSAERGAFDRWCRSVIEAGPSTAVEKPYLFPGDEQAYHTVQSCVPEDLRGAETPTRTMSREDHDTAALAAAETPGGSAIPEAASVDDVWHRCDAALRRYLASRAWASWVAHEAGGRGYVRYLALVRGVLRVEVTRGLRHGGVVDDRTLMRDAMRRADLLLVHLCSPSALARRLRDLDDRALSSDAEHSNPTRERAEVRPWMHRRSPYANGRRRRLD